MTRAPYVAQPWVTEEMEWEGARQALRNCLHSVNGARWLLARGRNDRAWRCLETAALFWDRFVELRESARTFRRRRLGGSAR